MNITYFEKRGTWWINFKDQSGARRRVPTGCLTEAAAKKVAPDVVAKAMAKVTSVVVAESVGVTVADAFQLALKTRGSWLQSKDKATLHHTYKSLGIPDNYPLAAVTRNFVRDKRSLWMEEDGARAGSKLSASSINHRLSMLSVLLETADLPPHGVKHLSTKGTRRTRRITDDEVMRACDWLRSSGLQFATLFAEMIVVALDCGARQGELLRLRKRDIKSDTMTFRDTKNGETRTIPMWPKTREVMDRLRYDDDGPFAALSTDRCTGLWDAMRDGLGLADDHEFVFHSLRHETASRLAAKPKANAYLIAAVLGHNSVTTTQLYIKSSVEEMRSLRNDSDLITATSTMSLTQPCQV